MKQGLFLTLYGGLWHALKPVLKRSKRLADGWQERTVPEGWLSSAPWAKDGEGCDIWLQAASGGESRLALAIIGELPRAVRPWRVLITTWTRQGRKILEEGVAELLKSRDDLHCALRFAPLDEPRTVSRALEEAKPKVLALLETELWPSLMAACRDQHVPLAVLNGRMTKSSYECYRIIRALLRNMPPARILAMCSDDKERFAGIFEGAGTPPCSLELMPNIKFDLAVQNLDRQQAAERKLGRDAEGNCCDLCQLFDHTPLALFASVREQEEGKLCPRILELRRANPAAITIIAPRHMHRVKAWCERFRDLGLNCILASSLDTERPCETLAPGSLILWDRFGDLPQLYSMADAAYVGGGYGQGGQNFLEALSAGVVPCVGSDLHNFLWALGYDTAPSLPAAGLLHICPKVKDVRRVMHDALQQGHDNEARRRVQEQFREWLLQRCGGTKQSVDCLLNMINGREKR